MNLLLKFVNSQFTESTLDGQIYFCRSGYFIDLEKQQKEKGIGDSKEGSWSEYINKDSVFFIETENGERFPLKVKSGTFFTHYEGIRNVPMCCFTLLSLENDFYEENGSWKIKHHVFENLKEQFKDRDALLFNLPKLLERVKKSCEEKELPMKGNIVQYYDERQELHPVLEQDFNKNPTKALFYKRKFFEFQKEYRIILPDIFEEDFILNLGDIRDITMKMNIEKLKSLSLKVINTSK